jgi:hypothetical protein
MTRIMSDSPDPSPSHWQPASEAAPAAAAAQAAAQSGHRHGDAGCDGVTNSLGPSQFGYVMS